MTDTTTLRASLIDDLHACRQAERKIFGALDPTTRDTPGADGGWSPKDTQAHLSAWRHRQATKMAAIHEGLPEPALPGDDIDATNALFHAERASWSWDEVEKDADATLEAFVAQIAAVTDEILLDEKVLAPIMGDGPEHDLAHLGAIAKTVGLSDVVRALADRTQAMLDDGVWPDRAAAVARYNLACYAALDGDLDRARDLLRLALPGQDDLLELAPKDDDLISLRGEIPALR